jgi:hypothetical protein
VDTKCVLSVKTNLASVKGKATCMLIDVIMHSC